MSGVVGTASRFNYGAGRRPPSHHPLVTEGAWLASGLWTPTPVLSAAPSRWRSEVHRKPLANRRPGLCLLSRTVFLLAYLPPRDYFLLTEQALGFLSPRPACSVPRWPPGRCLPAQPAFAGLSLGARPCTDTLEHPSCVTLLTTGTLDCHYFHFTGGGERGLASSTCPCHTAKHATPSVPDANTSSYPESDVICPFTKSPWHFSVPNSPQGGSSGRPPSCLQGVKELVPPRRWAQRWAHDRCQKGLGSPGGSRKCL